MSTTECYLMVFRREMRDPEQVGVRTTLSHEGLVVHIIWI
jgi:hypothetical protein